MRNKIITFDKWIVSPEGEDIRAVWAPIWKFEDEDGLLPAMIIACNSKGEEIIRFVHSNIIGIVNRSVPLAGNDVACYNVQD